MVIWSKLPCSSGTTYSRLPRTTSRWFLRFSKVGDCTASLGNLCQLSVAQAVKKGFSLCSDGRSCVSFCTHCLSSWHWSPLKRAWLHPPFTYWLIRFPLSLLFCRLKSSSSQSFLLGEVIFTSPRRKESLHRTLSNMAMSLLYWGAQNWMQHSRFGLTHPEWKERIISLDLLVILLLMQPKIPLAFIAARTYFWLT